RRVVRGRHSIEIEDPSGRGLDLGRVDETIAAHPDVVGRLRQFGDDIAALIVGDDDLYKLGGQFGRRGDHPDARLRTRGAPHDAAEIAVTDRDAGRRRLLRVELRSGCGEKRCEDNSGECQSRLAVHVAVPRYVSRAQRSTKWCAADPGSSRVRYSLRSRISGAPLRAAPRPGHENTHRATGSGRSWNLTTLLVCPLPPSMW